MSSTVMTVDEVAELLRIHRVTLYRMIKNGQIPSFRVGSDYRFNRQAIDDWRRPQETPPSPSPCLHSLAGAVAHHAS